jgi:hypothetical protein
LLGDAPKSHGLFRKFLDSLYSFTFFVEVCKSKHKQKLEIKLLMTDLTHLAEAVAESLQQQQQLLFPVLSSCGSQVDRPQAHLQQLLLLSWRQVRYR